MHGRFLAEITGQIEGNFPSQKIDELLSYGCLPEPPFNQQNIYDLIDYRNGTAEARPRALNKLYATLVIPKTDYDLIPAVTEYGSCQAFINAQAAEINAMLTSAHPLLAGLELRCLVRIDDNVYIAVDHFYDSSNSFGQWLLPRPYNPLLDYYFDPATGKSWGWIHEFLHWIALLPDEYRLDVDFCSPVTGTTCSSETIKQIIYEYAVTGRQPWDLDGRRLQQAVRNFRAGSVSAPADLPRCLEDIPEEWRAYFVGRRNDERGSGIMAQCQFPPHTLGPYMAEILARRVSGGWLHDIRRAEREMINFPCQDAVASFNALTFPDHEFDGGTLTVFRTTGGFLKKTLVLVSSAIIKDGYVPFGNPFSGADLTPAGLIPGPEATWFMIIEKNGQKVWRWGDLGDLTFAYLHNGRPTFVELEMQFADGSIHPDDFNHSITSKPGDASNYFRERLHLPIIMR